MPDNSAQAQLSRLFDEALRRVLKEAKDNISELDILERWPEFEQAFLERIEHEKADVMRSVSAFDRHSRLRTLLSAKLSALLATDDQYLAFMQPLRLREQERAKEREAMRKLDKQRSFLKAQRLVAGIELMRIAVMQGRFMTATEYAAISAAGENVPSKERAPRYWRGIGVIIRERFANDPFHHVQDIVLETPHAAALSKVFFRLHEEGRYVLTGEPRFYGRVAKAVSLLLERDPDAEESEVLFTALDGALAILKEWDDGGLFREGAELRGKTRLFPL